MLYMYMHVCFYAVLLGNCHMAMSETAFIVCILGTKYQGIQMIVGRTEKRERRREAKAERAAKLDKSVEAELLKRLQSGTYGDIYNFPVKEYEQVRSGSAL